MDGSRDSEFVAKTLIERFVSKTLVVPVAQTGHGRLTVPEQYPEKFAALQRSTQECMRGLGLPLHRSTDLLEGLLAQKLTHDMCYLPFGPERMIVLVRERLYAQLPEQEIVEQVHGEEVKRAELRGEDVPSALVHYYHNKPRLRLQAAPTSPYAM